MSSDCGPATRPPESGPDGGADAHVVQEYVGGVDELEKNLHAFLILHIQHDAALIAVGVFKIVVVALDVEFGFNGAHVAPGRIAFLRFNLNYIRSEISQPHSGNGSLLKSGYFDNFYPRQRSIRHSLPPDDFMFPRLWHIFSKPGHYIMPGCMTKDRSWERP
jgi:hypothetical protein